MARVIINLPSEFQFSTDIPIRIGDINRGNHLSHVAVLAVIEEARARFLLSLGFAEQGNIYKDYGYIVGDAAIIYKNQARYGQTLKVEIAAVEFQAKSFDFVYRITASDTSIEIARAKTGLLLFDYRTQKVVPVTPDFQAKFSK